MGRAKERESLGFSSLVPLPGIPIPLLFISCPQPPSYQPKRSRQHGRGVSEERASAPISASVVFFFISINKCPLSGPFFLLFFFMR